MSWQESGSNELIYPHVASAWALHRLAVASSAVDSGLALRVGLSSTEYSAMKHVLSAESPIGPVELGRLLGITSGAATTLVDRLYRSGHLERQRHPQDRRRVVLSATSRATEEVLNALEPLAMDLAQLDQEFTEQERQTIVRFLDLAVDRYSNYRESRP